jgi:hypothetical protein
MRTARNIAFLLLGVLVLVVAPVKATEDCYAPIQGYYFCDGGGCGYNAVYGAANDCRSKDGNDACDTYCGGGYMYNSTTGCEEPDVYNFGGEHYYSDGLCECRQI